jgi:hypothetical protein
MVADCINMKDVDDLSLVWKLLKNILNEYAHLKKYSS